jgi:ferredoxin
MLSFASKFINPKKESMKTTIYYFSATGNSLLMARSIANQLSNCELIHMARFISNETVEVDTERLGLVFPVYAWGLPRMVAEFVRKLSVKNKPYVFAVATCVAIPGNTLVELKGLLSLKGISLHAGYAVAAGRSSLMKLNVFDKIIIGLDHHRKRIKMGEARFAEILETIQKCQAFPPETSSWPANVFGSIVHDLALKSFKTIDNKFVVSESCTGCGNCSKICPCSNISIESKRPTFKHNCELCHACIQWCPNFAIKHPNFDKSLGQYRNPAVQMKELFVDIF